MATERQIRDERLLAAVYRFIEGYLNRSLTPNEKSNVVELINSVKYGPMRKRAMVAIEKTTNFSSRAITEKCASLDLLQQLLQDLNSECDNWDEKTNSGR